MIKLLFFLLFTQPNINTPLLEQEGEKNLSYFVPGFADLYFERTTNAYKPEAIKEVRILLCFSLG